MSENDANKLDAIELPDDLLDNIAGGELSQKSKEELLLLIRRFKGEGYGYSDFLASFQGMYNKPVFVANGYFDDALAFIGENW